MLVHRIWFLYLLANLILWPICSSFEFFPRSLTMNINDRDSNGGFVLPFFPLKRTASGRKTSILSNRVPFLDWIPYNVYTSQLISQHQIDWQAKFRNHMVATVGEYVGTTLFLFFAFSGTQVALLANTSEPNVVGAVSNPAQLLYIALSFGFSLAVNAWVFFRISGGLFNPAVSRTSYIAVKT